MEDHQEFRNEVAFQNPVAYAVGFDTEIFWFWDWRFHIMHHSNTNTA